MNHLQEPSAQDTENERPPASPPSEPTYATGAGGNNNNNTRHGVVKWRHSLPGQRFKQAAGSLKRKFRNVESFFVQECIAVAVWSMSVSLLSLIIERLIEKADQLETWQKEGDPRFLLAIISWIVLYMLPSKLRAGGGAPGFIVAHVWVLLRMEEYFDMFPNLACRVCEWRLGRIPKRALFLSFVIHSVVPCLVWGGLELVSSECSLTPSLHSLKYDDQENEQKVIFFLKEVFVATVFPVAVMVIPSLLKLNDFPEWLVIFCVYPIYSMGVDNNDKGSSLSFGALMAQSILWWQFDSKWRICAQMVGSLIAGSIMYHAFPDEPTV
mmetsp:Transcript_1849/g.2598  ORF Transcript_1849/g.2598 Transcript_1849/m.2598 type:complete len:325 (+) Transcript_1849:133-1107(+)